MKSTVLTGRQLMSSLRIGVIVVRNPLVYLDAKGRIAVAPNRRERRDAACWRGVQHTSDVELARTARRAQFHSKPTTRAQAARELATARTLSNYHSPPNHPAKLRAARQGGAR